MLANLHQIHGYSRFHLRIRALRHGAQTLIEINLHINHLARSPKFGTTLGTTCLREPRVVAESWYQPSRRSSRSWQRAASPFLFRPGLADDGPALLVGASRFVR